MIRPGVGEVLGRLPRLVGGDVADVGVDAGGTIGVSGGGTRICIPILLDCAERVPFNDGWDKRLPRVRMPEVVGGGDVAEAICDCGGVIDGCCWSCCCCCWCCC